MGTIRASRLCRRGQRIPRAECEDEPQPRRSHEGAGFGGPVPDGAARDCGVEILSRFPESIS